MKITTIYATTLNDAWHQCLYNLMDAYERFDGGARRYTVDTGSSPGEDRIEFDFAVIHISHPHVRPLIPQMPENSGLPPIADEKYLNDYMVYLLSGEKQKNEHYTYGERLQVSWDFVINYYKKHGFNTNRMCMEIGKPGDVLLYDDVNGSSPCMRVVDTRILDNKLHFVVYFRSWNLWSGFPVNLAGLQQAKEIMAMEIGVEDGEIIAMSKGLNIREHVLELAKARLGRSNGSHEGR